MVIRIMKILAVSSGLIFAMDYANRVFDDADTLYPRPIMYAKGGGPAFKPGNMEALNWQATLPDEPGAGWVRAVFHFPEEYFPRRKKELVVSFPGAYELYWEGALIGENGKPAADPSGETPGYLDRKYILPDEHVTAGKKALLLRYSDHKNRRRYALAEFSVDPYNEFYNRSLVNGILIYGLAGIFLIVAVYYFFLYFNSYRNPSFLLFALLCAFSFVLIVYAYSRNYYPYTYPMYHFRQTTIWTLSWIITLLLPLFYLYHFEYPNKKPLLIGIPALLLAARLLPGVPFWIYTILVIAIPICLVVWALYKRKRGAEEAMIGLIVFVASFMYFNISVYAGFGVLVIATLFSLSVTLGIERRKHEESLLRSGRLEAQLLKKNIQPHFLMNTLTNIISLIGSDPGLSVRLIEALSAEFYLMMEIAEKKRIPIGKETELCRAYLEVMSIRNDTRYELNTEAVGDGWEIPPAILHTLIENGITHNLPVDGTITFELSERWANGERAVILKTFGHRKSANGTPAEGTGLKYVKSRLEESFPGSWSLQSGPEDFGWQTKITIPS
ncbi:MAG: histidine kinase [Phaeodactylibacter sp.]|nr:histidine kinase [Phaeodactylibacter sp.]